jgi:hypothetical protein
VSDDEWPGIDDSIPPLDDLDAPWPAADTLPESTPQPAPNTSLRDAINSAVPMRPRKMSVAAWLDGFAADLNACSTREQAEAVILADEPCRASKTLTGEARARLRTLIDTALARYPDAQQAS